MPNRRFNKQVANSRAGMMAGGRAKKWAVECLLLEKTWHPVTTHLTWV